MVKQERPPDIGPLRPLRPSLEPCFMEVNGRYQLKIKQAERCLALVSASGAKLCGEERALGFGHQRLADRESCALLDLNIEKGPASYKRERCILSPLNQSRFTRSVVGRKVARQSKVLLMNPLTCAPRSVWLA
jgi:hypothetical protein